MNHTTRRVVAVVGALAASVTVVAASPAQAAEPAPSTITVRSSDQVVSPGEQFRLRGFLTSEGTPVPDATVRVKTFRDGAWVPLEGAVVATHDDGHYGVRIVLQMKGERHLRVVGNPPGDTIATARRDLVVTVK